MKPFHLLFAFAALPLLAFPFVAFAAVFWVASLGSIATFSAGKVGILLVAGLAQATVLIHPIVYGFSLTKALRAARAGDESAALRISLYPVGLVGASLVLFLIWTSVGR
ncbi:MAG: hypothetical protein HYV96_21230 [Opitutae bacterium]|nr:hypothetical protein [Opitutae bacterium]